MKLGITDQQFKYSDRGMLYNVKFLFEKTVTRNTGRPLDLLFQFVIARNERYIFGRKDHKPGQ